MSRASERLREFHETFDVERPTAEKDSIKRVAKAREKLHIEEHVELEEALDPMIRFGAPAGGKLARELADVMVHAYGTADLFGIDLDAAFEAVMDANMAKLPDCEACHGERELRGIGVLSDGTETPMLISCPDCNGTGKGKPIKRPHDGKVLKPEGWQEPDMSRALQPPRTRRELRDEVRKLIEERTPITGERLRELVDGQHVTAISFEAVGLDRVRLTGAHIVMDDRIVAIGGPDAR